jgi:hypothetical protein
MLVAAVAAHQMAADWPQAVQVVAAAADFLGSMGFPELAVAAVVQVRTIRPILTLLAMVAEAWLLSVIQISTLMLSQQAPFLYHLLVLIHITHLLV